MFLTVACSDVIEVTLYSKESALEFFDSTDPTFRFQERADSCNPLNEGCIVKKLSKCNVCKVQYIDWEPYNDDNDGIKLIYEQSDQ